MQKIILSDTSCLIVLEKIGELELLHTVFGETVVTGEVAAEYGLPLPNWISVQNLHDKNYPANFRSLPGQRRGERDCFSGRVGRLSFNN